jgi:hypothetical protein
MVTCESVGRELQFVMDGYSTPQLKMFAVDCMGLSLSEVLLMTRDQVESACIAVETANFVR